MYISRINKGTFTEEEKEAIHVISHISCEGVSCDYCDCYISDYKDNAACIRNIAQILEK